MKPWIRVVVVYFLALFAADMLGTDRVWSVFVGWVACAGLVTWERLFGNWRGAVEGDAP